MLLLLLYLVLDWGTCSDTPVGIARKIPIVNHISSALQYHDRWVTAILIFLFISFIATLFITTFLIGSFYCCVSVMEAFGNVNWNVNIFLSLSRTHPFFFSNRKYILQWGPCIMAQSIGQQ